MRFMNDVSRTIPALEYFDDHETINLLTTQIINDINTFVFIFDVELFVPVWLNNHFLKRMNYTQEELQELTAEKFLEMFHPVSREIFISRIKKFDKALGREVKTVYQLNIKDNSSIYMLTSTKVCKRNPGGKIKYLMGYAVEIDPAELKRHLSSIKSLDKPNTQLDMTNDLSSRELHIIRLIAKGMTDKEISEKLNISIHTTKTHRKRIIHKLGLKNSAALVRFAMENGLG
jgi:DNA-binding CsgD family transcriptional regulator